MSMSYDKSSNRIEVIFKGENSSREHVKTKLNDNYGRLRFAVHISRSRIPISPLLNIGGKFI